MRRLMSVIVLATSGLLLSLVYSSVLYGNPLNSGDESPTPARSVDLRTLGYVIPPPTNGMFVRTIS